MYKETAPGRKFLDRFKSYFGYRWFWWYLWPQMAFKCPRNFRPPSWILPLRNLRPSSLLTSNARARGLPSRFQLRMSKTTVKLASSGWSREVKRTKGGIDDGRQFLAQLTLVSLEEPSVYVCFIWCKVTGHWILQISKGCVENCPCSETESLQQSET